MNVNVLEAVILNRRVMTNSLGLVVVYCNGEALLHLQLQDDTISPQFSLTLWPRAWEAWQEIEARVELDAELSGELSSYPCQKFLISPRCLLPLCRAAILLHHTARLHVILSPVFPHWGPLMEAADSAARLWEISAANKADGHYALIKHDFHVRKDKNKFQIFSQKKAVSWVKSQCQCTIRERSPAILFSTGNLSKELTKKVGKRTIYLNVLFIPANAREKSSSLSAKLCHTVPKIPMTKELVSITPPSKGDNWTS